WLAQVRRHQLATSIELDQCAITTHLQPRARWASRRRRGVQRALEADVVVGMDQHAAPDRHVVRLVANWQHLDLLVLLEHDHGDVTGAAMDASTSHAQAPRLRLPSSIEQIAEPTALPEALTHVADGPLDVRLVLRMAHPRWVEQEPARLAVLEEA